MVYQLLESVPVARPQREYRPIVGELVPLPIWQLTAWVSGHCRLHLAIFDVVEQPPVESVKFQYVPYVLLACVAPQLGMPLCSG